MALLESFRKGTDSTSTRVFIGLVLLFFVAWGGGGIEDASKIVATVDGVAITQTERDRSYREMARRFGNMSPEQEETVAAQVLQKLIREEVIIAEAKRQGITVSSSEIARQIRKIEAFQDEKGAFDERLYKERVRRLGYTAGQFEDRMRRDLLVQRFNELVSYSAVVTRQEVDEQVRAQATNLEVAYVRLSTTQFYDDVVIADAERDTYAAANADAIKKSYDEDYDRFYNLPKRYQLSLILLRNDVAGTTMEDLRSRAEQVRALAEGGADFADLARRFSEDLTAQNGGSLGLRPAAQFDPAEVAAADAAGVGKVTAVVETTRGLEILKVEAMEDAKVISLAEATPDIAVKLMRAERVGPVLTEFANKVLANWTDAATPPLELLGSQGATVEVTESFVLGAGEVPGIGKEAELMAALADAKSGAVLPKTFSVRGSTVLVAVKSRTEPNEAEMETRRSLVEARLRAEREQEMFTRWVDDRVAQAKVEMTQVVAR